MRVHQHRQADRAERQFHVRRGHPGAGPGRDRPQAREGGAARAVCRRSVRHWADSFGQKPGGGSDQPIEHTRRPATTDNGKPHGCPGSGPRPGEPERRRPRGRRARSRRRPAQRALLQQIKGRIHRRLLERLNLSNLDKVDRDQVVDAIRKVVHDLLTQEIGRRSTSRSARSWSVQVLDEIFGLGPLEPLIQDPDISDILVNTYKSVFIERQRPAGEDRRPIPGRPAPAPGHRPHRLGGRPPHRRLVADGGRPPARRLARQRHHQAARDRRPPPLDPQVQARRADAAKTCCGTESLTEPMLELLNGDRPGRGSTS